MDERGDQDGPDGRRHDRRTRRKVRRQRAFEARLARKLDAKFHRRVEKKFGEEARDPRQPRRRTPEEMAYRDARKAANARLSVYIHGVVYCLTLLMLMVVTRSIRVPLIVGVCWGIGFGTHYFVGVVAPRLRKRWIDHEVGHRVERGVTQQRQVVQGEHVRSLEDLSASIAHELRNPITAAKSLVQQMGEDPVSHENIEYARVALDELDRVERSISHLLKYARDEELRFEPVLMRDVVESALETFRDRFAQTGVALDWQAHSNGPVRGDAEKLRRIVINLVGNAIDALHESGSRDPRLEVGCGENLAGTAVWVRVRDNGPGIDSETLRKIFSPFYTTKDRGTGLGLALSKKVIDAHGGTLDVEPGPGTGAEFVMTLPKAVEESGPRGGRS